ncbi:hypothetical protein, partial [Methanobrevibacter arboriphilus]|uniref:hypothetical protein n=1 Tax=Methanobrevibacter arboriphilus TaxID=39441 RepID=UPI002490E2F7
KKNIPQTKIHHKIIEVHIKKYRQDNTQKKSYLTQTGKKNIPQKHKTQQSNITTSTKPTSNLTKKH